MDEDFREVRFDLYCRDCTHNEVPETESPCNECLEEPTNLYTYKPTGFKEKEKGKDVTNNEKDRSSNR